MDELTLNGEKYISSKRAAKITGYTKDYVGQLCREGKIIAQLVGRNWYVSEVSIHKHRFELESQSPLQTQTVSKHIQHQDNVYHHIMNDSIHYTRDDADIIPLQKKEPHNNTEHSQKKEIPQEVKQEIKHRAPLKKEKSDTLSMMQSAWQEWFATTTQALKKDEKEDDETEEDQTENESVNNQDHAEQIIAVHKMSSAHQCAQDKNGTPVAIFNTHPINEVVKDEEVYASRQRNRTNNIKSGFARVVNIIVMIIALIFFLIAVLNVFSNPTAIIKQLQYVSGVSVYMAK